ncbi:MAG: type II secretion system protein GspN [Myxococcota bacterium]
MQKLVWILGGAIWSAICFRTALSVHFPSDEVQNRIQYEAQQAGYDLQFDDIGPSGLVGASVENAKILKVNKRKQTTTPFLEIDELAVSVNPFLLLLSKLSASIDAELFDGTAELSYSRALSAKGMFDFKSDIESLNLARIPIGGSAWSLDLLGKLNWKNDVHINPDKIRESYGTGQLSVDGLAIDGGKIAGIDLMELSFSEAKLEYTIDKGKVTVDNGKFDGEQLSIEVNGTIMLKKRIANSRLALELIMTFSDELKMMARFIPGLEDMGNDQYKLTVSGTLSSPSTGSKSSAGRKRTGRSSSSTSPSSRLDRSEKSKASQKRDRSSAGSAKDLETRRAERAKRLEERRAARQKRLEERKLNNPTEALSGGRTTGPRGIPSINGRRNMDEDMDEADEFEEFDEEIDEEDFEDDEELDDEIEEDELDEPSDDYED